MSETETAHPNYCDIPSRANAQVHRLFTGDTIAEYWGWAAIVEVITSHGQGILGNEILVPASWLGLFGPFRCVKLNSRAVIIVFEL